MGKISDSMPLLGSIHCQHCGELIDTLDTEKVTIYYSVCSSASCKINNESSQRNGIKPGLTHEDC